MLYEYWEEQLKQLEEELETTENEERKEELLELIENTKEQMLFSPTKEDLWEYLHWQKERKGNYEEININSKMFSRW